MRSRLRIALAATLAVAALALAGCTADPLAQQYLDGSNKGYISGDGTVTEVKEPDRGEPVSFTGTDEKGDTVSSADYAGQVLVLNFWYAGCAPCRAEAPDLEKLNGEFAGKGAEFLGVNVRDQAATALSDFAFRYLHNRVDEIRRDALAESVTKAAQGPGLGRLVLANLIALAMAGGAGYLLLTNTSLLAGLGAH